MKIAIIGYGNMGSGIAKQLACSHQISLYDRHPEKIQLGPSFSHMKLSQNLQEAISEAEIILLCIKPKDLNDLALELKAHIKTHQILVSVLAGISLKTLKEIWGAQYTIVRTMPNLAVQYGQGLIGCAESPEIHSALKQQLSLLFSPLGQILWLSEDKIDAFTSLAGSGPAFICTFIESMIDAGIAMGFSSTDATSIVIQTLKGTLSLLEESKKHPAELRWQISSPAGTTIAGQSALEKANVRSGIIDTFMAAYRRAKEF